MATSAIEKFRRIGSSLQDLRRPYEAHFRELGDHFQPRRTRFNKSKSHRSDEAINHRLINNRPVLALRTAQSGMHTGMTSPSRPWFRLIPSDPELRTVKPIRDHLDDAQREIRQMFQNSGLNTVLHTLYGDLALFGYDCAIIEDDPKYGLRGIPLVPGEYWIGAGDTGEIDTLYRETTFTVEQVVRKFAFLGNPARKPDWSNISRRVKKLWDDGDIGEKVDVCHLIMPRDDRGLSSKLAQDKPIMSVYWEAGAGREGSTDDKLLGDFGYDVNPILGSRWDTAGTDVYGHSPAMDALPDAKELQRKERDKAEALRRMNRPPMNAATELRNSPFSLMPEAVNFMTDPARGLVPAFQVNPDIQNLIADVRESEERINEALYADLFKMISQMDRRLVTAREIDERHEEKMLGLGPVLERQHREKLGPLLRRAYTAVVESGKVAPLPEEYADVPVSIDYVSLLAQAQKAVSTGGVERLYAFVGNIAAADPEAIDKLDTDAAIDEYSEMLGTPSRIVRGGKDVEGIRQQRQQAMEAQQAGEAAATGAQTAKAGAEAAKLLAESDATGRPVDILRNLGLR